MQQKQVKLTKQLYRFAAITYPLRSLLLWLTQILVTWRKKRLVFVFGMSRSGTTMLGEFLALSENSAYLHEPIKSLMEQHYRQQHGRNWQEYRADFWQFVFSESQKEFKLHCLTCVTLNVILNAPAHVETICIKPIAMVEAITEVSDRLKPAAIVYVSRHPCGRTESMMRQHRSNFPESPPLANSDLEALGREWGKTNSAIKQQFQSHPEWHWIFFETVANNPLAEFQVLYEKLGLSWSDCIRQMIQENMGEEGSFYETKRDSRKQAEKWRDILTEEQVRAIQKGCLAYPTALYELF